MHVFFTYLLLIITILSFFVLTSLTKRVATLWLVGLTGLFLGFLSVWFWRIELPFTFDLFIGSQSLNLLPLMIVDEQTWAISLLLMASLFTILLSTPSEALRESSLLIWVLTFLSIFFGLIGINAGTFYLLIIAFGALDIFEFFEQSNSPNNDNEVNNYPIINYALQTLGLLIIIYIAIKSGFNTPFAQISTLSNQDSIYLLLGFFLRAKIFPPPRINQQEGNNPDRPLTLLLMIKTAVLVSATVHFSNLTLTFWVSALFQIFILLIGLYFSWTWITINGAMDGIQYFLIGIISISLFDLMIGAASSSLALTMFAIFFAGLLQQHIHRSRKKSIFLLIFSLFGLALPFTFNASIWTQAHIENFISLPFITLIYILLIFGFIKHVFENVEGTVTTDQGGNNLNWISIILLVSVAIVLGIWGWSGAGSFGIPIIYIPMTGLFAASLFVIYRFRTNLQVLINAQVPFVGQLLVIVSDSLSRAANFLYEISRKLVGITNALIESDGALLWTILILMIILLFVQGGA